MFISFITLVVRAASLIEGRRRRSLGVRGLRPRGVPILYFMLTYQNSVSLLSVFTASGKVLHRRLYRLLLASASQWRWWRYCFMLSPTETRGRQLRLARGKHACRAVEAGVLPRKKRVDGLG